MTRRLVNGMALLDLRGSLTADASEPGSLRTRVAQLADEGFADIAVNLDGVTRLDAHGLGELVRALLAARERGRRLTFVAPPPRVQQLLSLTQLDTVFDVCGSERDIVRADQDRRRSSCAILASSTRIFSSSV